MLQHEVGDSKIHKHPAQEPRDSYGYEKFRLAAIDFRQVLQTITM